MSEKYKNIKYSSKLDKRLCGKHIMQFINHGKFLDSNARTINDLNEIVKYENYAEIVLYDKSSNEINRTKIDLEDIEKCKNLKWRINKKGKVKIKFYVYSGSGTNQIILHRLLLGNPFSKEVDHINSDTLDNRKNNLRVVSHAENTRNSTLRVNNKLSFTGICKDSRYDDFKIEGQYKDKRYYFKHFKLLEEAVFIKFLFDCHFFGDLRSKNNDSKITEQINKINKSRKIELKNYFHSKTKTQDN